MNYGKQIIIERFKKSGFQFKFNRVKAGLYKSEDGKITIRKRGKFSWEVLDMTRHFYSDELFYPVTRQETLKEAKDAANFYGWQKWGLE